MTTNQPWEEGATQPLELRLVLSRAILICSSRSGGALTRWFPPKLPRPGPSHNTLRPKKEKRFVKTMCHQTPCCLAKRIVVIVTKVLITSLHCCQKVSTLLKNSGGRVCWQNSQSAPELNIKHLNWENMKTHYQSGIMLKNCLHQIVLIQSI